MKSSAVDKILIRLATRNDSDAIVRVQYDSIKMLAAKDYTAKELEALLKSKSLHRTWDEIIFVAEIKGEIVGLASLVKRNCSIGAVFVDPDFVRQGIGSKLLSVVEQEAIKHNIKILGVCSSLTGCAFYGANGYKNLGKTYIPLHTVFVPCIAMKKRLIHQTRSEYLRESVYQLFVVVIGIILLMGFIV
ncbi:MAG: GNAT family N-acetyltransferase [Pleurocapsa sp.]